MHRSRPELTIGFDLGDRTIAFRALDPHGELQEEGEIDADRNALLRFLSSRGPCRIVAVEGTLPPWLSQLAELCGRELLVAPPESLALIPASADHRGQFHPELLARLAQLDPRRFRSPGRHALPVAHLSLSSAMVGA